MNDICQEVHQRLVKRTKSWDIENLYIVALRVGRIVGIKLLSQGSGHRVTTNQGMIEKYISRRRGTAFILAHNHPSNLISASVNDIKTIKYIRRIVEYPCIGSLVYSQDKFITF